MSNSAASFNHADDLRLRSTQEEPDSGARLELSELLVMHQSLQAQIASQTEFTHLLVHQLATPLTAIQGSIDLLLQPDLSPAHQAEFFALVQHQIQHLQALLQGLIKFHNLETGTLATHPEVFGVPALVQEVAQLLPPHPLVDRFAVDLPTVWGDRWQVSQVMLNLLSNAIKYSPAVMPVEVGAAVADPGWVQVWVRDRGLGIPLVDQPRLFEQFYRVKHTDRANIPGTGLGLSLCKLLVENQGGTIGFESVHGEGSRFYLTLPIAP
jgi:signal transduction histidine kinase